MRKAVTNLNPSGYHNHWNIIRVLVVHAFNYECQICCLKSVSLHVHHIDGNKANNVYFNLIPLCPKCHKTAEKSKCITFNIERTASNRANKYLSELFLNTSV